MILFLMLIGELNFNYTNILFLAYTLLIYVLTAKISIKTYS